MIIKLYEESKELEKEELEKVSKFIFSRIEDKLNGKDFFDKKEYDVKDQVDTLINQATSVENLCQLFAGWCPFL